MQFFKQELHFPKVLRVLQNGQRPFRIVVYRNDNGKRLGSSGPYFSLFSGEQCSRCADKLFTSLNVLLVTNVTLNEPLDSVKDIRWEVEGWDRQSWGEAVPEEPVLVTKKVRPISARKFSQHVRLTLEGLREIEAYLEATVESENDIDQLVVSSILKELSVFERKNLPVCVGFVGETGAGKSAIINRILGYNDQDEGPIVEGGRVTSVTQTVTQISCWEEGVDRKDYLLQVAFISQAELAALYASFTRPLSQDDSDAVASHVFCALQGSTRIWDAPTIQKRCIQMKTALECIPLSMRELFQEGAFAKTFTDVVDLRLDMNRFASSVRHKEPWYALIKKIVITGPFENIRGFSLLDFPGKGDGSDLSAARFESGLALSDVIVFVRKAERSLSDNFISDLAMNRSSYLLKDGLALCYTRCGEYSVLRAAQNDMPERNFSSDSIGDYLRMMFAENIGESGSPIVFAKDAPVFALENDWKSNQTGVVTELDGLIQYLRGFLASDQLLQSRFIRWKSILSTWHHAVSKENLFEAVRSKVPEIVSRLRERLASVVVKKMDCSAGPQTFDDWKTQTEYVYTTRAGKRPRDSLRKVFQPKIVAGTTPYWKDLFVFFLPMDQIKLSIRNFESALGDIQDYIRESVTEVFVGLSSPVDEELEDILKIADRCIDFILSRAEIYRSQAAVSVDLFVAQQALMRKCFRGASASGKMELRASTKHPKGTFAELYRDLARFTEQNFDFLRSSVEDIARTEFIDVYGALEIILRDEIVTRMDEWLRAPGRADVSTKIRQVLSGQAFVPFESSLESLSPGSNIEALSLKTRVSERLAALHETISALCSPVTRIRLNSYKYQDLPRTFIYLATLTSYFDKLAMITLTASTLNEMEFRARFEKTSLEGELWILGMWETSHAPLFERLMNELFSRFHAPRFMGSRSGWFANVDKPMLKAGYQVQALVEAWVEERKASGKPLEPKRRVANKTEFFEQLHSNRSVVASTNAPEPESGLKKRLAKKGEHLYKKAKPITLGD